MIDDVPPFAHARISLEGFDPWREAFRTIQGYEVWQTFGDFVSRQRPEIGPGVRESQSDGPAQPPRRRRD